jgi:hypothetical protein
LIGLQQHGIALSDTALDQVNIMFTWRRTRRMNLGTPIASADSAATSLSLGAAEVGLVAGEDVAGFDGDVDESFGSSVRREVEHL